MGKGMGTGMEMRTRTGMETEMGTETRMGTAMRTGAGRAQRQGPRLPRAEVNKTWSWRRMRVLSHGRRGGRTKRRGRVGGEGPVRGPPRHGGIKAGRRQWLGQRSSIGTMQLGGAALLLCAAGLGLAAAPAPGAGNERRAAAAAGRERRVQFASWDEVNVLAHGLLQLGHGLKEHVERTKGQLRELGGRLSAHNSSLGRLLRQAREAQERGERLRGSVRELEGRGRQLLNLSEALRQRLEEVAADKDVIQGRLERLEGRVRLALQARPDGNQSARDLGALQVSAASTGGAGGGRDQNRPGGAGKRGPDRPLPLAALVEGHSPGWASGEQRGPGGTGSTLLGVSHSQSFPELWGSPGSSPAVPDGCSEPADRGAPAENQAAAVQAGQAEPAD